MCWINKSTSWLPLQPQLMSSLGSSCVKSQHAIDVFPSCSGGSTLAEESGFRSSWVSDFFPRITNMTCTLAVSDHCNEDTSLQELPARSQVVTKRCRALKQVSLSHSLPCSVRGQKLPADWQGLPTLSRYSLLLKSLVSFPALQRSTLTGTFLSTSSCVDPAVNSPQKSIALKWIGKEKYGSVGVLNNQPINYTVGCHSPALLNVPEWGRAVRWHGERLLRAGSYSFSLLT